MLSNDENFVPLRISEIAIGKPLPWPVYDDRRTLLLRAGYVLETQNQLETIASKGLFRNMKWHSNPLKRASSTSGVQDEDASPEPANEQRLENVRLKVGEVVQLQTAEKERYLVKLVGYFVNQSFIVSAPVQDGSTLLMREGKSFVVRFFAGRDAFAFNTNILKVYSNPFPHLHLAYPKVVRAATIRAAERASVDIIASVARGDAPPVAAKIIDMSMAGAQISCAQPFGAVGDEVAIAFRLKGMGSESLQLTVNSAIRRVAPTADNPNVYDHGVQFLGMSLQETLLVQNLIYQKLLEIG
jgi:c-di-GMP-binding flagellar brake protein YcgR